MQFGDGRFDEFIWRGQQWMVTTTGIESLDPTHSYVIPTVRLHEHEDTHKGWPEMIAHERWADLHEFMTAWCIALLLHGMADRAVHIGELIQQGQDARAGEH